MAARRAEQRGVDIEPAAGDDQPVDPVEINRGGIGLVRQQHRQAAGMAHCVAVILADRIPRKLRLAARRFVIEGETDDRLCHAGIPIDTGVRRWTNSTNSRSAIQTYDIDFAGIVSNIVFIRWLEDLRLGLMDEAYPLVQALGRGCGADPAIDADRLSPAGDDRRQARRADAGRRARAGCAGGSRPNSPSTAPIHAEAEQEGLFMRLSTRRPIAIPEPIRRRHPG